MKKTEIGYSFGELKYFGLEQGFHRIRVENIFVSEDLAIAECKERGLAYKPLKIKVTVENI